MSKEKSDLSDLEKIADIRYSYKFRTISTIAVCFLGGFTMWLTDGQTGIGWALLGIAFIWG